MVESSQPPESEKPKRLYFKTYLQMIRNSIGTTMFRNFYVRTDAKGEFDSLENGAASCAFYVSALLCIFQKLERIHGTVESTVKDLQKSGWQKVERESDIRPGDVVVWQLQTFENGSRSKHIGFAIGEREAVSTSRSKQVVAQHDLYFGKTDRPIELLLRMPSWD